MQRFKNKRMRFALLVVLAMALVVMTVGALYAAGEQLERGAVLSGGNTTSADGMVLRSVIGITAAGSSVSSSSGAGLCSGFGCDVRTNSGPSDPGDPQPTSTPGSTPGSTPQPSPTPGSTPGSTPQPTTTPGSSSDGVFMPQIQKNQ